MTSTMTTTTRKRPCPADMYGGGLELATPTAGGGNARSCPEKEDAVAYQKNTNVHTRLTRTTRSALTPDDKRVACGSTTGGCSGMPYVLLRRLFKCAVRSVLLSKCLHTPMPELDLHEHELFAEWVRASHYVHALTLHTVCAKSRDCLCVPVLFGLCRVFHERELFAASEPHTVYPHYHYTPDRVAGAKEYIYCHYTPDHVTCAKSTDCLSLSCTHTTMTRPTMWRVQRVPTLPTLHTRPWGVCNEYPHYHDTPDRVAWANSRDCLSRCTGTVRSSAPNVSLVCITIELLAAARRLYILCVRFI